MSNIFCFFFFISKKTAHNEIIKTEWLHKFEVQLICAYKMNEKSKMKRESTTIIVSNNFVCAQRCLIRCSFVLCVSGKMRCFFPFFFSPSRSCLVMRRNSYIFFDEVGFLLRWTVTYLSIKPLTLIRFAAFFIRKHKNIAIKARNRHIAYLNTKFYNLYRTNIQSINSTTTTKFGNFDGTTTNKMEKITN